MSDAILIRKAERYDVPGMLDIYAYYVAQTAVSFEHDVPSLDEFEHRLLSICQRYPWLVIEKNGHLAGYAYASSFHPRAAYAWCAEASIYLARHERGAGLGAQLYSSLEKVLKAQNFLRLYACIAHAENEDEYLTHASIRFHTRMGYRTVGAFPSCGFKFNRWYGMIWMEKVLGHADAPRAIIPFCELA